MTYTQNNPFSRKTSSPVNSNHYEGSAQSRAINARSGGYRVYNIAASDQPIETRIMSAYEARKMGFSPKMGRTVSSMDYIPRHKGGYMNIGYVKGSKYTRAGGWKPKKLRQGQLW